MEGGAEEREQTLEKTEEEKRQRDGWRAVERERGDEKLMGGGGRRREAEWANKIDGEKRKEERRERVTERNKEGGREDERADLGILVMGKREG